MDHITQLWDEKPQHNKAQELVQERRNSSAIALE